MNRAKGVNRLFLVLVLLSAAGPFLFGRFLANLTFYQSTAVSQALYFVPVLIYIGLNRGEILEELQLRPLKPSAVLLILLLCMLLEPVMSWLNLCSMFFAENYMASSMMELDGMAVGRNLMYIAVVPALAEEFMFRGVFYHGYRKSGVWKAAFCSGLCFGLLHMNLNQFFYAFVLGMVFALLVEATGSIVSSVFAHFLINANSVMLLAVQSELEALTGSAELSDAASETLELFTGEELLTVFGVYTVLALICGAMAFGVLKLIAGRSGRKEHMQSVWGRKKRVMQESEQSQPETEKQENAEEGESKTIFTPALLLGIVGAVTYMVVTELIL